MLKGRLGNFIRSAREEKRMEQKVLAKTVNKTTSTISQIESGNLVPGDKLLQNVCQALGLDFKLAWHIAQVEKARPGLARQTSLHNLRSYEQKDELEEEFNFLPKSHFEEARVNFEDSFTMVPKAVPQVDSGFGRLCVDDRVSGWFAFRRDWLDSLGGPRAKILFEVKGNSMSPLIEDGDIIMVDQSMRARQVNPGRIYVVASEDGPAVKRIYFGQKPGQLILASENSREFPDRELTLVSQEDSPVIGRVLWLGRQLLR